MRSEDEQLKRAILGYDLVGAEQALRAGANPNVVIGEHRTRSPVFRSYVPPARYRALHLAAHDDDAELAALLLLHGANPNAAIYRGMLPISIAARHNQLRVVEVLLYEYVRPAGNFAHCPLSLAAAAGHLEMVELLLAKRADQMNVAHALHSAVSKKDNFAVVKRLVAAGARAGHRMPGAGEPPHTIRMRAVRFVPEAIPLFAGHAQLRLIDAAIDGDIAAATQFLDEGASPDDTDTWGFDTALTGASRCGHLDMVQLLIERGASLRGPKNKADPLMSALRGGHTEVADLLWSIGARTRDMVVSCIVYRLPLASVRWAIEHQPRELGFVAYTAARVSRMDVMRLALKRGADPSFRWYGRSILMLSANRGALDIVKLLIEHGADLGVRDNQGFSALDHAIAINDMDDPEDPFEFTDASVQGPVAQLLLSLGLKLPSD